LGNIDARDLCCPDVAQENAPLPKKLLSDRTLGALRRNPPKKGSRLDVMDTAIPGFGVRVYDAGKLTPVS